MLYCMLVVVQAISQGAVDLDLCQHVHYFDYNGTFPRTRSGLQVSQRMEGGCFRVKRFLKGNFVCLSGTGNKSTAFGTVYP